MGKFTDVVRKRIKRVPKWVWILLLLIVITIPVAVILTSDKVEDDDQVVWDDGSTKWTRRDIEDIRHQLQNAKCPAQAGKKLKDFWRCLWGTTRTADGIEQHEQRLWERERKYEEAMFKAEMEWAKDQERAQRGENINKTFLVRKKRQIPPSAQNPSTFVHHKATDYVSDVTYGRILDQKNYMTCQQKISPATNIYEFLYCIRRSKKLLSLNQQYPGLFGRSLNATYQTTTFPPFESEYEQDDLELVTVTIQDKGMTRDVLLKYDFKTLTDEEHASNFFGADPYMEENRSPFRYKYDNSLRQDQPAWSYTGEGAASRWHILKLEQFLTPMKRDSKLKDIALTPELAQIYPALGSLVDQIPEIGGAPLEHGWSKDKGHFAYTRFLPPLLTSDDLEYYKIKGLITEDVTAQPPSKTLRKIINALGAVKDEEETGAQKEFATDDDYYSGAVSAGLDDDAKFKYGKAYRDFIEYFWKVPTGPLRKDIVAFNTLHDPSNPLDSKMALHGFIPWSRHLLHAYMDVAKVQMACVEAMLGDSDRELTTEAELEELVELAKKSDECPVVVDEEVAVTEKCIDRLKAKQTGTIELVDCVQSNVQQVPGKGNPELRMLSYYPNINVTYYVPEEKLISLYKLYWERMRARQRYSLPVLPKPYPICRHNNPSPIDILTESVTESTLRDYVFSDAAFRLNRFFMFFPLDGSPLLTVGIADGERLDGSTVKMTGGAVRGHALYFQYMHIHYAHDWQGIGSEHRINGEGAPMEIQMVFTISGSADALKYWHILARVQNQLFQFRDQLVIVLSVLVDVEATDEDVEKRIKAEKLNQDPYLFEPLAQAAYHFYKMPQKFQNYEEPRGYVSLDPVFRFIEFIPRVESEFYTYRGSLTWPPCFPYVIWSVYAKRLVMSKRQFDQFVRIPAYGINDHQYVAGNIRQFDDIWVEEEKAPNLMYYQMQIMKELRTIDRTILGGLHTVVEADGSEHDNVNRHIVSDAVYEWEGSHNYRHRKSGARVNLVAPCLLSCLLTVVGQTLLIRLLL